MQVLDRTGVGTLWSICKTKFALAGHTHNYAGSGSAGGPANSAISVVDYGQTSKTIQIGYSGSGITGEQIKYIAGYTSGSGDVNAKIKDVSKDALRSWLGLGSLAYSSTALGAAAGKNVRTLGSVSHSSWANATTDDQYVPTMSFIAYWNGAYNSSGNSNLQYCYKGKFGNLAVKDTADWSQVANKPTTATRWPSWGEVTGKPDLKNWSETKSYIDNKAASSGGVDSLPAGTLLRSYNSKNIFGDNWKLADGSNVVTNQLPDLQDVVESNGNTIKETKQNVVEFNKYSLYFTRAACNFGGKFYVVNRPSESSYTYANLFIIDENSCTSHYISNTPQEGIYTIQVNSEDIFIFVKLSDSLIVYYSKNEPNIKFTRIELFVSTIGIDTNDNTLDSFSMIGGGKAIAVYSPKSQYDSQIVFQIYDGKYQRISDKFKKNISQLGWLNGSCYCAIDNSVYKISSDYNISQVFTDSNKITKSGLKFYSNYCIICNYDSPCYYTKDFNTYTAYNDSTRYIDFNIYRSLVCINGANNENEGFRNTYFAQIVNNKLLTISLDDSSYYIAIGLLTKNDNMYFLTMGQNFNTFRIYKMHIPIGSKVLPNISDTYIKVK